MTVRWILCVAAVAAAALLPAEPAQAQTGWLTRAGSALREQLDTDRPRVFRRSIDLEDASLETLKTRLGWFGIDLPLDLRGDVTARLGVEIDLSSPRDARSYRINGSLSSDRLVVEGLDLRNFSATARYVDGRLTLEQLVVTVPDPRPNAPAGRAVGESEIGFGGADVSVGGGEAGDRKSPVAAPGEDVLDVRDGGLDFETSGEAAAGEGGGGVDPSGEGFERDAVEPQRRGERADGVELHGRLADGAAGGGVRPRVGDGDDELSERESAVDVARSR